MTEQPGSNYFDGADAWEDHLTETAVRSLVGHILDQKSRFQNVVLSFDQADLVLQLIGKSSLTSRK